MEVTEESPRLRTVRLLWYIESDATAICFLRSGDDVGALGMLAMLLVDDTLDDERGLLAIIHIQRARQVK